jgi:hypothetical protein
MRLRSLDGQKGFGEMQGNARVVVLILLAGMLACFANALILSAARGQNAPHPHHGADHFYATWYMPDKPAVLCCNMNDCAPARAKFENGVWFARWTDDEPWVQIPPHKVERERDMPDGQAHLCGYREYKGDFTVYCFGAGAGI